MARLMYALEDAEVEYEKMLDANRRGDAAAYVAHAARYDSLLREAVLTARARKNIPKSSFAVPEKAPGSGSYPIHDRAHAANALARASGKPVYATVKAKVCAKYPDMPVCKEK